MHRRALLAAILPVVGAGCSALSPGDDAATESEAEPTATPTPTPQLPLTAAEPAATLDTARGVEIRSERPEATFTTVVVEDGDRTLYAASGTVGAGETWHHDRLVARPGIYRVVVETEAGERAVHGWVVGERWGERTLVARLTPGRVDTRQIGICRPGCPPLRAEGESVPLPRESRTDPGREVAGAVTLQNDRDRTAPVSLRVARDGDRIIEYTYGLPAGVRIIVPVVRSDGIYDLTVSTDDRAVERQWHVPEEPFPQFRVDGDGPAPDCEFTETRITEIRNAGGSTRTVGIALQTDDGAGGSETVRLAPETGQSLELGVPSGRTTLSVFVDGERQLSARWSVCPGGEFRVVVVNGTVFVRNDERVVVSAFAGRAGA